MQMRPDIDPDADPPEFLAKLRLHNPKLGLRVVQSGVWIKRRADLLASA
jgi:hypothetical protein